MSEHDYKNNGVKTDDTDAEKLLRQILTAYYIKEGTPLDRAVAIDGAMNHLRWYIEKKDGCEFVEDWGATCRNKAVRVSHSIPCCEEHAIRRDRSLP